MERHEAANWHWRRLARGAMSGNRYYDPITLTVGERDAGMTVRTVLQRRLGVSRKLLSRLKLTEQGLTLNGRRVYTSARVEAGDIIALRMEREQSDDILPQEMPLDIVHEDDGLLVVNKAAGVIVHPTHGHYTDTLANGVVHHWRQRGETVRFRPVHRLDQETSGIVVIAKNAFVHQQLSEQMRRDEIDKTYIAYVYGSPSPADGTVEAPIDRDPDEPHVRIVTPAGYPSVTHYGTVRHYDGGAAAKLRLRLETGRTHQIRVHMRHIGCPLIGDKMYGLRPDGANPKRERWELAAGRQALHAAGLALTHPLTGERVRFEAELPAELARLEKLLEAGEQ